MRRSTAADGGFADYKSKVKVEGNVLKYKRNYWVKSVYVPEEKPVPRYRRK